TLDRMPSISLASDFTGRTLDRTRIGRSRPSNGQYGGDGRELVWGGDLALEAEQRRARAQESDDAYSDGRDPSLWEHGQSVSGLDASSDPSADADKLSADPPIALAIAAESGAQCDDTADRSGDNVMAAQYGDADSFAQERDDEQTDEAASGLSAVE